MLCQTLYCTFFIYITSKLLWRQCLSWYCMCIQPQNVMMNVCQQTHVLDPQPCIHILSIYIFSVLDSRRCTCCRLASHGLTYAWSDLVSCCTH